MPSQTLRPVNVEALDPWPLRVFVAGVLKTTAEKVDPGQAPLILDAIADVRRESFDPAESATDGIVHLRMLGESDGVKFDVLKYHVTAPRRLKIADLDDAEAAPG